ncbi:calcium-binding protein, partial [Pseudonocardia acaciae]|uniref:calcium-binding protein n=1 Tax=Pseudonocardia acaciae TaxID=551276 RepID=UPI0006874547
TNQNTTGDTENERRAAGQHQQDPKTAERSTTQDRAPPARDGDTNRSTQDTRAQAVTDQRAPQTNNRTTPVQTVAAKTTTGKPGATATEDRDAVRADGVDGVDGSDTRRLPGLRGGTQGSGGTTDGTTRNVTGGDRQTPGAPCGNDCGGKPGPATPAPGPSSVGNAQGGTGHGPGAATTNDNELNKGKPETQLAASRTQQIPVNSKDSPQQGRAPPERGLDRQPTVGTPKLDGAATTSPFRGFRSPGGTRKPGGLSGAGMIGVRPLGDGSGLDPQTLGNRLKPTPPATGTAGAAAPGPGFDQRVEKLKTQLGQPPAGAPQNQGGAKKSDTTPQTQVVNVSVKRPLKSDDTPGRDGGSPRIYSEDDPSSPTGKTTHIYGGKTKLDCPGGCKLDVESGSAESPVNKGGIPGLGGFGSEPSSPHKVDPDGTQHYEAAPGEKVVVHGPTKVTANGKNIDLSGGPGDRRDIEINGTNNSVALGNGNGNKVKSTGGQNKVELGDGDGNDVSAGDGDGNTITVGDGHGNRSTVGNGSNNKVRGGQGNGNTVSAGSGNSNDVFTNDGNGNTATVGDGDDNVASVGHGNGNVVSAGNGNRNVIAVGDGDDNKLSIGDGNGNSVTRGSGARNEVTFGKGNRNKVEAYEGDHNTVSFGNGSGNTATFGDGSHNRAYFGEGDHNAPKFGNGDDNIAATGGGDSNVLTAGNGNGNKLTAGPGYNNTVTIGDGNDNSAIAGPGLGNKATTGAGVNNQSLSPEDTPQQRLAPVVNNPDALKVLVPSYDKSRSPTNDELAQAAKTLGETRLSVAQGKVVGSPEEQDAANNLVARMKALDQRIRDYNANGGSADERKALVDEGNAVQAESLKMQRGAVDRYNDALSFWRDQSTKDTEFGRSMRGKTPEQVNDVISGLAQHGKPDVTTAEGAATAATGLKPAPPGTIQANDREEALSRWAGYSGEKPVGYDELARNLSPAERAKLDQMIDAHKPSGDTDLAHKMGPELAKFMTDHPVFGFGSPGSFFDNFDKEAVGIARDLPEGLVRQIHGAGKEFVSDFSPVWDMMSGRGLGDPTRLRDAEGTNHETPDEQWAREHPFTNGFKESLNHTGARFGPLVSPAWGALRKMSSLHDASPELATLKDRWDGLLSGRDGGKLGNDYFHHPIQSALEDSLPLTVLSPLGGGLRSGAARAGVAAKTSRALSEGAARVRAGRPLGGSLERSLLGEGGRFGTDLERAAWMENAAMNFGRHAGGLDAKAAVNRVRANELRSQAAAPKNPAARTPSAASAAAQARQLDRTAGRQEALAKTGRGMRTAAGHALQTPLRIVNAPYRALGIATFGSARVASAATGAGLRQMSRLPAKGTGRLAAGTTSALVNVGRGLELYGRYGRAGSARYRAEVRAAQTSLGVGRGASAAEIKAARNAAI